jgi:5-methylcytosine-specific restriction endonuclease McrA
MQNHVKVYRNYYSYGEQDILLCERCGKNANDIHHIEPRSKFGSKTKNIQDDIKNLIALCRECHTLAHKINIKEDLKAIHLKNL